MLVIYFTPVAFKSLLMEICSWYCFLLAESLILGGHPAALPIQILLKPRMSTWWRWACSRMFKHLNFNHAYTNRQPIPMRYIHINKYITCILIKLNCLNDGIWLAIGKSFTKTRGLTNNPFLVCTSVIYWNFDCYLWWCSQTDSTLKQEKSYKTSLLEEYSIRYFSR